MAENRQPNTIITQTPHGTGFALLSSNDLLRFRREVGRHDIRIKATAPRHLPPMVMWPAEM